MGNAIRAWHPLLIGLALGVAQTSCGEVRRRTPDDTLVVVAGSVIRDLDPRFALTSHDVKLSRLVVPGLTTSDTPTMAPELLLAESIEPRDPLTWDVRLRPGLTFSSGEPVTAGDVAFSYQSVLDPDLGSLYRKGFEERFRSVEATGELTVRFHLVAPLATLMSDLDFGIVSKAAADPVTHRFPGGVVVGAGAYSVESFDPESVVLVRNDSYFGPPAVLERIHWKTVRDANARNLMLAGGSADFVQNAVRVDLVDALVQRPRISEVSGPSAILTYLMMHNGDPVLRDIRVRRAIALAIDRERIIESKFRGRAVRATGLLAPSHWAYNGEVDRNDFNPAQAMRLLDEAGYPDPDGPGGKPRLSLSYKTSADQFRLAIARLIARHLGEVGIEVDVRPFEFGTFFADVKAGNFQLASMQTAEITEPDFYFTYFHSSRIPTPADPHTHNRWHYRNARVDELTVLGREVSDREERRAIYAEVQEILARELPVVPLWHEDNVAVMNVDVEGYQVLPNARLSGLASVGKRR